MNKFFALLLFAGILFGGSDPAQSKDLYFFCEEGTDFKLSRSWFGSGEVFYGKGGEWKKDNNALVTDDHFFVSGWKLSEDKCGSTCEIKVAIPLIFPEVEGSRVARVKLLITSSECKRQVVSSCVTYKKGEVVGGDDCKIAEK